MFNLALWKYNAFGKNKNALFWKNKTHILLALIIIFTSLNVENLEFHQNVGENTGKMVKDTMRFFKKKLVG